jgi:hypothetical protein
MSKYTVIATWDDAPHLSEVVKARLMASIPPHQRAARTEGVPFMGAGMVYPVDPEDILIADFQLPMSFKRAYGFDTGWNWNGAVWGALDPETDTVYIYKTYKRGQAEPAINATAIMGQGRWIPGVADAADINRLDGKQYLEIYRKLGLDIELPDKAVESGIQNVWSRLTTGRLRVFASCADWFDEFRVYSRNEKGIITTQGKGNRRDLMDATRFLIMSGLRRAKLPPTAGGPERILDWSQRPNQDHGWMGT